MSIRPGPARSHTVQFLRRTARWFCAVAALAGLGACVDFDRIDRNIDHIVQKRSGELGGSATTPRIAPADIDSYDPRSAYETDIPTVNPSADQIDLEPADPARELSDRLDRIYAPGHDGLPVDLEATYRLAQQTAREFITAEEDYILSAITLLIERHNWNPRFFNTLSVDLDLQPDDGAGNNTAALNVINDLRVTQRLPYGGNIEASLLTSAAQQLTSVVGDQYEQNSRLQFSADIPLMRNAGLFARETIIQAERDLIYAARDFERFRRTFLVSIASDYFSLVAQEASIRNAEARLDSVEKLLEQTAAFVDAGRTSPFELQNVRQNLLSSRANLINSQESFQIAKDRFKIRLGLPVSTPIDIIPSSLNVLEPKVDLLDSARKALRFRLDYQTSQNQIDDSRRAVENSKNQLLPDLDVRLSAGFNTDPSTLDFVSFDAEGQTYAAGVTFGLPLDREIERLQLRRSIILLQRSMRNLDAFRDNIVLDARAAVREIDRARLTVVLQSESVEANRRRQRELELKSDEVTAQARLDAENELLDTLNSLDNAVRDLNNAILDYLLVTGQMRVKRTGDFQPPPGLVALENGTVPSDESSVQAGEPDSEAGSPDDGAPQPDPDITPDTDPGTADGG